MPAYPIKVQLLNPATPPTVAPSEITVYLPDKIPSTPFILVGTEAVENRETITDNGNKLKFKATLYREVELPTAAVKECFRLNTETLKTEVDPTKAAALFAMFNYVMVVEPSGDQP